MAAQRDIEGFAFATLLESFVELIRDACLAVSPDGRILAANEEAGRVYGRSTDELTGMHAGELAAPGKAGLMPHGADDVRAGVVFDSVHVRADCSRLSVRVSAKASEFSGREIILATVLEDCDHSVTEEQRIKSTAFDAAFDAIIVHDRDGNLLHFNEAAAEAARMTCEEFARIGPWGWVPPAGRPSVPLRLDALLDSGSLTFESTGLRADGTTYANEVHARSLTLTGRTVMVAVIRDISERRRAEAATRALAYHDALTGLPNRSLLSERAEQAMAEATRHGDLLGLAFIDLNEFKAINDDIGHHAGDSALMTIAERLVSAVRAGDTVARFGGDEFVVMLPRLQDVRALERIGSKLAKVIGTPLEAGGRTIKLTASIGLAVYDPLEDGLSSLLSKADMAMYSAKRAGESWRVFDESTVLR